MRRVRSPEKPLSPSAAALLEVTRKLGQVRIVAQELGVSEGAIRHLLNGLHVPKLPLRQNAARLWQIPVDGWELPEPAPSAEIKAPPAVVEASTMQPGGQGVATIAGRAAVLVEFETEALAASFRDKLHKAGVVAKLVETKTDELDPNAGPEVMAAESLGYLRGVVRDAPKGRQTQAGISAAKAVLDHVHAITPPPKRLEDVDVQVKPTLSLEDELRLDEERGAQQ